MYEKRKPLRFSKFEDASNEDIGGNEEKLENVNSFLEQRINNFNKERSTLLLSNTQSQPHLAQLRTFDSRGINTSSIGGTQSVQALHQSILNLDRADMNQVQNYANLVHDSPLRTDTIEIITRHTAQASTRQKIVGKKPKDVNIAASEKMRALSSWTSTLEDEPDETVFRGTTAEGLYKRERAKDGFVKVEQNLFETKNVSSPIGQQSKYDYTNVAVRSMRNERDHDIVKNALEESSSKFNFSSTIPNSWSRSGLYLRNEKGLSKPLVGMTVTDNRQPSRLSQVFQEANGARVGAVGSSSTLNQFTEFQQERAKQAAASGYSQKTIKNLPNPVAKKNNPNAHDVHFFESQSKFIPLKVFNQLYGNSFSHQMGVTVQARSKEPKTQMVKKWFQSLSLQEQSVAITTVDKELVQLFKAMYKVYQNEGYGGGEFTAKLERCDSVPQAEAYKKVGNYQLLYQKNNLQHSEYIGKKNQAANLIIEHTRIISIKEPNDALTLDVSFISCYSFFLEIMKLIDTEFLQREYKLVKTTASSISGSLLVGHTYQQSIEGTQQLQADRQRTIKEKPYFIIRDEHKPVYVASSSSQISQIDKEKRDSFNYMCGSEDDEALSIPGYQSMIRVNNPDQWGSKKRDDNHVSFAKCLLLMYEKAINVQYQDYMDKLQQTAAQSFFFIGKNELQDNIFSEDLKIADFWQRIDDGRKQQLMNKPLNTMIKDLLREYNEAHKPFDNIAESAEYEEDCDEALSSSRTKSDFDSHEYDEAMDILKKPFQMDRVDHSRDGLKLTQLPTEYTEFNGQSFVSTTQQVPQFNHMIIKGPRRSRKERARGGPKSGTGTTSSSGINIGGTAVSSSMYDYNPNHLTSQYGNQGGHLSQANMMYAEDLELGMGGSTNNFSINNDQLSDQADFAEEHMDPEALLPLTHFSNSQSGLESFIPIQEETKDPAKKQRKIPKINVQIPDSSAQHISEENETGNELFNKSNPDSILFGHKQSILSNGLKARNDFSDCLKFIKGLSANKNFEYALKEYQSGTLTAQPQPSPKQPQPSKNKKGNKVKQPSRDHDAQKQNLSQWELTNLTQACKKRLQSAFLKHLEQECQKSILEDLLIDTVAPSEKTSGNQPQAKRSNGQMSQKDQASQSKESASVSKDTNGNTINSTQQLSAGEASTPLTIQQKKNKKKQKRKKNRKAADLTAALAATSSVNKNESISQSLNSSQNKPEPVQKSLNLGLPLQIELMPIISGKKKKAKLSDDDDALETDQEFNFRSKENYSQAIDEQDEIMEDTKLQQVLRVHQELAKVQQQDDQLEEIKLQYEKLETVERFLDANIDPKIAIEMAGLTFSTDKPAASTRIDPQYLDLLQGRNSFADEELGHGKNAESKKTSKLEIERYESWIKEHLNNYIPPQKEQAQRQIKSSREQNDKLFQDLHQLSSRIGTKVTLSKHEDQTLSDEFEEEAKESLLRMAPVGFRTPTPQDAQSQDALQWQRFQEERRGLLSDQIHLEKYPQETLQELTSTIQDGEISQEDDEQIMKKREERKMVNLVLEWQEYQSLSTKTETGTKQNTNMSNEQWKSKRKTKITSDQKLYQRKVLTTEKDDQESRTKERKVFAQKMFDRLQESANATCLSYVKDRSTSPLSKKDKEEWASFAEIFNKEGDVKKILQKYQQKNLTTEAPSNTSPSNSSSLKKFSELTSEEADQHLKAWFNDPTVPMNTAILHALNKQTAVVEQNAEQSGGTALVENCAEKQTSVQLKKKNKSTRRNKKRSKIKPLTEQSKQNENQQKKTTQDIPVQQISVPALNFGNTQNLEPSRESFARIAHEFMQSNGLNMSQRSSVEKNSTDPAPINLTETIKSLEVDTAQKIVPEVVISEDDVEVVILDDNVVTKPERDCLPPKVNTFFGEDDDPKSAHGTSQITTQSATVPKLAVSSKYAKKEARKQRKAFLAIAAQNVQSVEKSRNEVVPDEVVMIDSSVDESDKEQESYVIDLTKNLISNSVISASNQKPKLQKKKRKKQLKVQRGQGEKDIKEHELNPKAEFDAPANALPTNKYSKMSHLVTPFLSLHKQEPPISKISSKSSTTNSLANFDSSYTGFSPFVKNLNKEKTTTHRFRADLSDSVSIPKRGTSSGSYGKREQEHSKLLDELDSLFPAQNKGSSNNKGSFSKIRSSTLSKTRQTSHLIGHVGAFTTSSKHLVRQASPINESDILFRNAVKETDIQSQQQQKIKNLLELNNIDEIQTKEKQNSLSPRKSPERGSEDTKLRVGKQQTGINQFKTQENQLQSARMPLQQPQLTQTTLQQPLTKAQARKQKNTNKKQQATAQLQQEETKQKGVAESQESAAPRQQESKETSHSSAKQAKPQPLQTKTSSGTPLETSIQQQQQTSLQQPVQKQSKKESASTVVASNTKGQKQPATQTQSKPEKQAPQSSPYKPSKSTAQATNTAQSKPQNFQLQSTQPKKPVKEEIKVVEPVKQKEVTSAPTNASNSQQAPVEKPKNSQKKQKGSTAAQAAPILANNFSSYDTMFNTIFGSKSISAKVAQPNVLPKPATQLVKEKEAEQVTGEQAHEKKPAKGQLSTDAGKSPNGGGQPSKQEVDYTIQTTTKEKAQKTNQANSSQKAADKPSMKPMAITRSHASISEVFGDLQQPKKEKQTEVQQKQPQKIKQNAQTVSQEKQSVTSKDQEMNQLGTEEEGEKEEKQSATQPFQEKQQQRQGGIGVIMTPSRNAQTQVIEHKKQAVQGNQSQKQQQFYQQTRSNYHQQSHQQQFYQHSYVQTPNMQPIQQFQHVPGIFQQPLGQQQLQLQTGGPQSPSQGGFTSTSVNKQQHMKSSYFQTTTYTEQTNLSETNKSQTAPTSLANQEQTEQQRLHRGVQFPLRNQANTPSPQLITPGSQVSSVQMTVNFNIVNNQTCNQAYTPSLAAHQRPLGQTAPGSNLLNAPLSQPQQIQMNIPSQQMNQQMLIQQYMNGLLQGQPQHFPNVVPGVQPFPQVTPFPHQPQPQFMFQNQHQMMAPHATQAGRSQGFFQANIPMTSQPFNAPLRAPQQTHLLQQSVTSTSSSHATPTPTQPNNEPSPPLQMRGNENSSEKQKNQAPVKSLNKETSKQQQKQLQQSPSPSQSANIVEIKNKEAATQPQTQTIAASANLSANATTSSQQPMNTQTIFQQPMPFSTAPQYSQPMQRNQQYAVNKFQLQFPNHHTMHQHQMLPQYGGFPLHQMAHHPQHFPSYNQSSMLPFQMAPQYPITHGYQTQSSLQARSVFEPFSLFQALTANGVFTDKNHLVFASGSTLTEVSCNRNEERFFELIGKQIISMQNKIEERLARVEPLRQDCFNKLFDIAKQTYTEMPPEKIEFKVYGSMATKLAIDTSDMDISIHGVVDSQGVMDSMQLRQVTVQAMDRIFSRLTALEWIESNMLIDKASVPVIKLVINLIKLDKLRDEADRIFDDENMEKEELKHYTQLKIDLIFNDILRARQVVDPFTGEMYTEQGDSQSTQKCADFIKKQISKHPFLRPLTIILKKYLALKCLNSPFQGTMSSYGLVLMLLALLKDISVFNPNLEAVPAGSQLFMVNLGKTFAHFLLVFGEQFSVQHFSIDENSQFAENQQNLSSQMGLFSGPSSVLQVTDPIDPSNNVGKQTYNFNLVQDQLHVTWQCLLVRFRQLYEKICHGEELLRKYSLLERAHEVKSKRTNQFSVSGKKTNSHVSSPNGGIGEQLIFDPKIAELPTSLIFDYLHSEHIDQSNLNVNSSEFLQLSGMGENTNLISQKNQNIERLTNRSQEQLKEDKEKMQELLNENKREIEGISSTLLNMIVMIKSDVLTALQNDEIEEKQKIMQQFSRDEKNYILPLERLKNNLAQKSIANQQLQSSNNFLYNPHQIMQQQQHLLKQTIPQFHHQQPHFAPQIHSPQNLNPNQVQHQGSQNNFLQGYQQQFMEQFATAAYHQATKSDLNSVQIWPKSSNQQQKQQTLQLQQWNQQKISQSSNLASSIPQNSTNSLQQQDKTSQMESSNSKGESDSQL